MEDVTKRTLAVTRLVNAPRELVWKLWTEPEHIKHWWGPNGFTNTISKMDVRVGGTWEFVMHGPDGKDYPNKHEYIEVVKPEKLVMTHMGLFIMTATFEAKGDKTLITMSGLFETPELLQQLIKEVSADKGMKENMDKLETYLAKHFA
jgi:uncharacterized protein YndB with AHSA1/START domain